MEKKFNIVTFILLDLYIITALILSLCTKINIFFKGWYLLLILIPCISRLLFYKSRINSLMALASIIVVYLTIINKLEFNKCFIILICIGIITIGMNVVINSIFVPDYYTFNRDTRFYWSLFSETKEVVSNVKFNGCTIWSIFGSTTLNLYQSKIEDNSVIKVVSIFGSTNVMVKENTNIILKSINIFGDSKNLVPESKNKKSKNVYIKSKSIFGSFRVR